MSLTLFTNGRLAQGSSLTSFSIDNDAVIAEHGKILAVGQTDELKLQLSGRRYRTVDWEGAYVLPGLTDSHMHLSMHGMKLGMLDFTRATSKAEMLEMLRERAQITPPGEWILGLNWNENAFQPAIAPDIHELDAVTDRHPVFLTRTCFHAFLGNSEAFRRAGIGENTTDPVSGAYGRDEHGRLNGWVYEEASLPFNQAQPEPEYAVKKACIKRACEDALRLGLTAAHTEDLRFLGSVETMLRIYKELREEGLAFRTHQLIYYPFLEEAQKMGLRAGSIDEWLAIGAVKLFADGAIGGRTALLRKPYHDAPGTKGMAILSQEKLNDITQGARRAGFPIAVHSIGDGAADMVLTSMETNRLDSHARLPDRFIHAQVLDEELVARMSRLRVAADIQPRFVASDFPWVLERLGPDRTDYLYAWRKLLDAGIACAGGSDAPIEPLDPFLGIHAAVTRRKLEETHDGYLPEEKLDIREALRLFTSGSAAAAGETDQRGLISEGYAADFTVVEQNIFEVAPDSLPKQKVLMTVVNGRVAYQ
ncbi:amidohydrolase [Paenibacillus sp. P96]|uniref:Amidohydrolase n=1 Tax=Paenibacillus zeirhizosphaerae TaxID=2987519 RepID=A0ABT9FLI2_9BACL|nr:amidohydrolase [Paenibacillus sp. P96]MDP4095544.1 amidohydrolase [Paenibacillus sp. P96]